MYQQPSIQRYRYNMRRWPHCSVFSSHLPDHSRPTFHISRAAQVPQMGQDLSSQANADEFSRKFAGQKQDRLQYKPRPDFKGGGYCLGPLLAVIRYAAYPWLMA